MMDKYARTGVHDVALVWQCSFCGLTFDNLEQCKSSRRARIGKVLCNKDLSVCRFFCEYILFLKLDSTHLFLSVNLTKLCDTVKFFLDYENLLTTTGIDMRPFKL